MATVSFASRRPNLFACIESTGKFRDYGRVSLKKRWRCVVLQWCPWVIHFTLINCFFFPTDSELIFRGLREQRTNQNWQLVIKCSSTEKFTSPKLWLDLVLHLSDWPSKQQVCSDWFIEQVAQVFFENCWVQQTENKVNTSLLLTINQTLLYSKLKGSMVSK